jgi:hypothetical protein
MSKSVRTPKARLVEKQESAPTRKAVSVAELLGGTSFGAPPAPRTPRWAISLLAVGARTPESVSV